MNLTKKVAAWFLTLVMVLGLVPQTVFAEETDVSPIQTSALQYEVLQEVNEDKTEATISLEFTGTETVQLEKVTFPDGTEKTEDLDVITYAVSENGKYDFKVDSFLDGAKQEETIPVEVTGLEEKKTDEIPAEEKEQPTSDEMKSNGNPYEVSNADDLKNALEEIGNSEETEATIILTADIGSQVNFVGVADKSITVKSTEGQKYALILGSELAGDITLDNVKATAEILYCSGHRTIFTENCEFTISRTLYGGGYKKTVPSVYVKINGKGKINTADNENVVIGGSYKGSVEGDIYVELAGNISYGNNEGGNYLAATNKATAYGGDPFQKDLYVGGNVTLILDSPVNTQPQNVIGAYNSHVGGDVTVQVKAGYFNGINGMREDSTQSIVDGNIHIIAGDPAYEDTDRICRLNSNWDITGAGEQINNSGLFQVKGNVIIDTYENVWGWDRNGTPDYDPPGIVGADSAVVDGDVTINVYGSHLEDITGVDESLVSGSFVKGNVTINTTDAELKDADNTSYIYPISDGKIGGNATINMNGGSVSQINCSVGTTVGNTTVNITGKPQFTLQTDGVWGQKVSEASAPEKSVLNFDKAETSIPIVGYFTEMNVTNDSDVTLGNEKKNAFSIYDVNINSNAKLTTNKQAYSKGALTMDHGTWVANGYLYVTKETNTQNSELTMNDYAAFGYGYKDDSAYDKTVVTSSDDIYTFNKCDYTDKIYGNVEITNSIWSVFVPTIISGNYNAATSKLNLLAFTGDENYPDKKIPLEILGAATGNTAVTLVDKNDTSKEGVPVVGQNYINALKTSEKTFELANKNAQSNGLYFKKLADANIKDKADYDMWQVAQKDAYRVLYSFENGTPGKTLPSEVTDLLPADSKKYYEGDTINALQPSEKEVEVSDGVWKFTGYDEDSKIANANNADENKNITFTGTWVFEEKEYDVSYKFESANKDKELPKEITDQLPKDGSVKQGSTVNAPDTKFDDVEVSDGTWTFKGWTPDKYENVTGDVEFVGTWEFKKNASIINRIPIISASDKTLTVGDEFDPKEDVTATDVEDGDLTKEIEILKNEVDTSEAGVYEVTYKVTDSEGASSIKTIYVTVNPKMEALNHIPVINASDKTLTVGDKFDPRKDVTATDKEDGDITKEIEILKNEVDTSEAGVYEVTYKVTDSQGASSVKTIYVTVNPKMEALNHIPVINASDKTLTVGDKFDPLKDVTATDKEDGDLTKEIEILKNEVDTTKAGVYEVTYKVTDSQGASSVKTIYVTVNPKMEALNHIPVINASDKTLTVGDKFDPRKDVTATDKEDGDLTKEIEILKNEVDTTKAGVYEVTYKVTDSKGASSVKTIYVTVNPKMEVLNHIPVINASDKTLTVGDKFDPRKDVTATDKEDGDLTKEIEILKNEVDTTKAGVYEVTYKVTDSKGASSVKTIYVTVNPKMEVLNHIPVINASDKTLTVGDKFDPLKDVTATDKEDGDLTKEIEILKNEVDTTKAGVYEVTYKVTDSQGASSVKTIYVTVNPKMEALNHIPVINASDKTLTVGDKFDPLKDVTAADKEDGDLTKEIEILKNEVDTTKAGVYGVTYKVTDSQGASSVKTIKVTVTEKDTPVVPDEPNKPNKPNKPGKPDADANKPNDTGSVETGDKANVMLWGILLAVSGVGAIAVYWKKRKINQ